LGALFIISAEAASGKTAICAGLAVNLVELGKKVSFSKPGETADSDIAYMKEIIGTNAGQDVVITEITTGRHPGDAASKSAYNAARESRAKVIAVEAYTGQSSQYFDVYKGFGTNLLGVILNKVPAVSLKTVKEKATADFSAAGVKLLGAIPESRALLAITVGELAEIVRGKIINNPEKSGELVENYMLGAMVLGSGIDYFQRKSRKAAIIHGDRPDMQLAALDTPTVCLVLSGNRKNPVYNVFQRAESRGIPIIITETGTPEIIEGLENALSSARLRQEKKLPALADLVKRNLDIKTVV
jgi:uncharacterized protein